MNISRWAAVPAAVTIVVVAAACGGSKSAGNSGASAASKPPATSTLVKEVKSAAQHASSVHVSGTVTESGKTMALNLSMNRAGGMGGQLSVNGAGFTVLSTRGSTYIKVTSAFLGYAHLPTTACKLVCGKYLKVPAAQAQAITGSLSMSSLLGGKANPSGNLRYVGTATVNGQRAWVYRAPDGSTAYVASRGTPYLLRLVAAGSSKGRLDFTQWNSATIPGPPPASQVVDLSQLHG